MSRTFDKIEKGCKVATFDIVATYHHHKRGPGGPHVVQTRSCFMNDFDAYRAAAMVALGGASYVDIYDWNGMWLDVVVAVEDEVTCAVRAEPVLVETVKHPGVGRFGTTEEVC